MPSTTFVLALLSLLGWGIGAFFSKLATNRIGERSVLWDMIGYVPAIIIYYFLTFKTKDVFSGDKLGFVFALLAGAIGSVGLIAFYLLISKRDAGLATAVTAMYPVLTAILSFIFLGEKITVLKTIGISLATIALFLLAL